MQELPVPAWLPNDAAHYLAHTEGGCAIRALARQSGCHASTVLRQIRRLENRRDDTLVDEALRHLGRRLFPGGQPHSDKEGDLMNAHVSNRQTPDELPKQAEIVAILRLLAGEGSVLAVAHDMENAVVVAAAGAKAGHHVVPRHVAQMMALNDWIACDTPGRVMRYQITAAGRAVLARSALPRDRAAGDDNAHAAARRNRYGGPETPLMALSRRKDKNGKMFLAPELVSAGERLREDFELAQIGPRTTQNWDSFLTGGVSGPAKTARLPGDPRPMAARDRVAAALRALGPGLGDVALRCCCYLEGLETAEKRMGWSARSGKIVLRIALQRLKAHYDAQGHAAQLIG